MSALETIAIAAVALLVLAVRRRMGRRTPAWIIVFFVSILIDAIVWPDVQRVASVVVGGLAGVAYYGFMALVCSRRSRTTLLAAILASWFVLPLLFGLLSTCANVSRVMQPRGVRVLLDDFGDVFANWFEWSTQLGPILGIANSWPLIMSSTLLVLFCHWLLGRERRRKGRASMAWPTGSAAMYSNDDDVTRLATASAISMGSLHRRSILDRAEERYRARAPEPGLDTALLHQVCSKMESRETSFQVVFAAGLILGLAGLSSEQTLPVGLLILMALAGVFVVKRMKERSWLLRLFRRGDFDREKVEAVFGKAPRTKREQNVVCYRGFNPFEYAGISIGGWSFALDMSRAKPELGVGAETKAFEMLEVYEAIEDAVESLRLEQLECRDLLFVGGADLPKQGPLAKQSTYSRPQSLVDDEVVDEYLNQSDPSVRGYKRIQVTDWGGQLIVSYFLRCTKQGNNLFVEATRRLMTPVAEQHRAVDRLSSGGLAPLMQWLSASVFLAPFVIVGAPFLLFAKIGRALGFAERELQKQIRLEPKFNFGALGSTRLQLAGVDYESYFQLMDKNMFEKTLERQVLDAVADFLSSKDVDVSEIKERQTSILNHGIMIQQGDVNANNLAVGKGALAGVIDRFGGKSKPAASQAAS